jgi:hypothetical protein
MSGNGLLILTIRQHSGYRQYVLVVSFTLNYFSADTIPARQSRKTRSVDSANEHKPTLTFAIQKFEREGDDGFSSSIVDLFDSLRSPITFLQDLEWSDEYQQARFFTSLAKVRFVLQRRKGLLPDCVFCIQTISKAIEQYCRSIEELFMTEMFPRPTDYLQPQKSSAWLEKAKQLAQGEKKIEPYNFQPASCVKLNNVDGARKLLDNMYNQIQADKLAEIIETQAPPVPSKNEDPRFLFTVKIAMAENLVPLDSSPSSMLDTFVTLSDQDGHRLAKTRTIYEALNPRCGSFPRCIRHNSVRNLPLHACGS